MTTSTLPPAVKIREVGARDGFQNEPELIPTATKLELIAALARTGVPRMELTSFVRPDVIPQLGDAAAVLEAADVPSTVERSVVVPNPRGLDNALRSRERFDDVNVFLSASESHNQHNVNRSVAESLAGLKPMLGRIAQEGLRPRASISTAFGCPYEGRVDVQRVVSLSQELAEAGAVELVYGDTTGMANPVGVREFFGVMRDALGPDVELTAHFHNTHGQGLANVFGALEAGCASFDSSFGELGGCPVPPGATGNIATEDLVSLLDQLGVETGVDIDAVLDATRLVQDVLGRKLTSHTIVAGPIEWSAGAA